MKTQALKDALNKYGLMQPCAERAAMRKNRG